MVSHALSRLRRVDDALSVCFSFVPFVTVMYPSRPLTSAAGFVCTVGRRLASGTRGAAAWVMVAVAAAAAACGRIATQGSTLALFRVAGLVLLV